MRFVVTIGQRWKHGSPYVLGKVLAIGVLLAVPTLALGRLSADLIAAWQSGSVEQATLLSNSSDGLLAFDAPSSTLRQYQLRVKDSSSATEQADNLTQPSLLVKDWRYTAQPTNLSPVVTDFVNTLVPKELILDARLAQAGMPPNAVGLVALQQFVMNRAILQEISTISQGPLNVQMINGFIGNLVLHQLVFDNWLSSNGVPPNAMILLLSQQLSFNEVLTQNLLLAAQPNVQPKPLQPASPSL